MIIFGFGGSKLTDRGAVWTQSCPNCKNTVLLKYVTTHASFRLFFVPIVPYDRKHYLMCPVCNKGPQLNKEGVAIVAQAQQLLARARMGELTEGQYQAALGAVLHPGSAALPSGEFGQAGTNVTSMPAAAEMPAAADSAVPTAE